MTLRVSPDEIVAASTSPLLGVHESWERVRLADIAGVLNGFPFKSERFSKTTGTPLLRIRDVGKPSTDVGYQGDFDPAYLVHPGDQVIGMDGDFRIARWAGPEALLNQRVCKVEVRDREQYDPSLLLYALPGYLSAINRETSSVTVKHLSSRTVADIPLPLPPLREQRRIVAAIEEQFSRLDAGENTLAHAASLVGALRRSAVAKAVGGFWAERSLEYLARRITKGTTPTSVGHSYTDGGVRFVKAESLSNGLVDYSKCAFISPETDAVLRRSRLEDRDVLVTIAGTLGRVAVVRSPDLPANANQAVSVIRLKDPSLAPWLAHWLQSPRGQAALIAGARGVGLQNLNLRQVGAVSIPIPPDRDQDRIVAELEESLSVIDAMRAAIESAQRRSASLRRSILECAFRGELVPQDSSDEPASVLLERIRAERATGEKPIRPRRAGAARAS